ncbi:MAG: cupredoxin domain-containing protein [Candidatus Heimdallarchaeota archaeon]|nr:cupredoxin domain-containing protein [Candidatus Heimdallarchaeota archaeon]
MIRTFIITIFLIVFISSSPAEVQLNETREITVSISGFSFNPDTIVVNPGENVTFTVTNEDSASHTFTISSLSLDIVVAEGETKSDTVIIPDDFSSADISCRFHSSMSALLTVPTETSNSDSTGSQTSTGLITSTVTTTDQASTQDVENSTSNPAPTSFVITLFGLFTYFSIKNKTTLER